MKTIIGKSYLIVPHAGGELTFQYPAFEGTYGSVAKAIDKEGLKRPNSPETASLVYDAFQNPNNKYSKEIIDILNNINNNYFWEFIGNLYLPKSGEKINNGVIIEHNPKIKNGKLIMNKNSLIKRLQSKDSNVKFVPFGFKTGEQTWQELEKNLYIIARYGKEGAEKIAKVASKYKNLTFFLLILLMKKKCQCLPCTGAGALATDCMSMATTGMTTVGVLLLEYVGITILLSVAL